MQGLGSSEQRERRAGVVFYDGVVWPVGFLPVGDSGIEKTGKRSLSFRLLTLMSSSGFIPYAVFSGNYFALTVYGMRLFTGDMFLSLGTAGLVRRSYELRSAQSPVNLFVTPFFPWSNNKSSCLCINLSMAVRSALLLGLKCLELIICSLERSDFCVILLFFKI